jgi:hypothetical protein
MTYREKRVRFTRLIAGLIEYAHLLGYEVALKHVYRCPDCPVGKSNSLHKSSLAADLDLYIDGTYRRDGAAHAPLHDWWDVNGGEPRIEYDMNHYAYLGREVR